MASIQNNDFKNYKNKSKFFESFNGTEIQCFFKIPTGYDEYGRVSSFELVKFANISSISGIEQYDVVPIPSIGFSHPTGIATGSSLVTGNIVFEVLNQGFVNDVIDVLAKAGIEDVYIDIESDGNGNETPKYGFTEIKDINDFPTLDLVLIGVKENDPNKKIQKQIVGIRFNKGESGVGITQISVREQYTYIGTRLEDFKPVEGASEDEETVNDEEEISIFE